jgi:hypothetical protein
MNLKRIRIHMIVDSQIRLNIIVCRQILGYVRVNRILENI